MTSGTESQVVGLLTDCMSRADAKAKWLELGPRMKRFGYRADLRKHGDGYAVFAVIHPGDDYPDAIGIGQVA